MMINIKKFTIEDKFARKYYYNTYRFVAKCKKRNRKEFRKRLKIMLDLEVEECYNNKQIYEWEEYDNEVG